MFSINRNLIERESFVPNSKNIPAKNDSIVFDGLKLSFVNYIDTVTKWPIYNASHWVNNIDRWHNNLNNTNTYSYKRGDILFVDLGAQNFGNEPSYNHACIVLKNNYNSILVVPCSTKQYASGRPGIIDATPADGFLKNTGIQTECFRWISKNRVVSHTRHRVTNDILNKLDNVLLSLAPSINALIISKDQTIAQQQQQITNLQNQLTLLTKK